MKFKLIRKRGGRSYTYRPGGNIPNNWSIEDENGNKWATYEEYEEANKPKPVKKAVVKKEVKEDKE